MSAEQGFLSAICETPEDDAPRLVYADWLDDNGQAERAEFIRLQCRLAQMDEWADGLDELVEREKRLLKDNEKKWRKVVGKFTPRVEFRRGFVEGVAMPIAKFLDNADALFATAPVRSLRPLQIKPRWDEFLASPHLRRLRMLDIHTSALGVGRVKAVGECEHLADLHQLNLGMNKAGRGAVSVLRSTRLTGLRKLRLNDNDSGDELAQALSEGQPFPHLRHLDLQNNSITAEGARQLARIGWLRQLETLDLSRNPITDAGVEALAASDVWANQRSLDLHYCKLTGASAGHLAGCRHLGQLRELVLETERNDSIAGALARSPHLRELRVLDLSRNVGLSEADADALVRSPSAPNLRRLRLHDVPQSAQKILLQAKALSGLIELRIDGDSPSSPDGRVGKWIREATHLENLAILDVSSSGLGDKGLTHLAQSPHLARLIRLDVSSNHATSAGVRALLDSPHLRRLRYLRVGYAEADKETRQRILDRMNAPD